MKKTLILIIVLLFNFNAFSQCPYEAQIKRLFTEINKLQNLIISEKVYTKEIETPMEPGLRDRKEVMDELSEKQKKVNELLAKCKAISDKKLHGCQYEAEINRLTQQFESKAKSIAMDAVKKYKDSNKASNYIVSKISSMPELRRINMLRGKCGLTPIRGASPNIQSSGNSTNNNSSSSSDYSSDYEITSEDAEYIINTLDQTFDDFGRANSEYKNELRMAKQGPEADRINDGSNVINHTADLDRNETEKALYGNINSNKKVTENKSDNFSDFEFNEDNKVANNKNNKEDNKKDNNENVKSVLSNDGKLLLSVNYNFMNKVDNNQNNYSATVICKNLSAERILLETPIVIKIKDKYVKFKKMLIEANDNISRKVNSIKAIPSKLKNLATLVGNLLYKTGKCECTTTKTEYKTKETAGTPAWCYAKVIVKTNKFCKGKLLVSWKDEKIDGTHGTKNGTFFTPNVEKTLDIGPAEYNTGKIIIDKDNIEDGY